MPSCLAKRLLVVGWDAADWKIIHPLMDAGKMPALEKLVNGGVMGSIATLHPVLSPMLWTSIATGKRPYKHGVWGFAEPVPGDAGIRPVSSLSRKVKAVWNILNQNGHRSIVVGWWPSHPAEPLNGVMVSNHYAQAVGPLDEPWPLLPGAIHPPRLTDQLAELRLHPSELAAIHILPFVPRAAEVDQEKDRRLAILAKTVAEVTTIHAAATWLMAHEPWDFMAVYFDGIDHLCHGFMRYHPPRRDFVPESDYELYKGVVEAGYRYHDLMLRTLVDLAGADTTIMLVSDHGFHPDHLRPRRVPLEPAGPAYEHRDFGVFVMKGPGIRRDEYAHGVNLLDITPTVLTLFDLPVGADMDGRTLVEAFEEPPIVRMIPSWEDVSGEDGHHAAHTRLDPVASQAALNQLVALGYIEKPDQNSERAIANTVRELRFNLARSYMDAGLHGDAVPILQELYADRLDAARPGIQLAMCYRALGNIAAMGRLVNELTERRQREAEQARATLKEVMTELQRRKSQRDAIAPGDGRAPQSTPDGAAKPLITDQERRVVRRLRVAAARPVYVLEYLAGFVDNAEGRYEAALEHLSRAEQAEPDRPGLHLQIGETYLNMKRWDDAERAFAKAVALDSDSPHAHLGLARSYLRRGRNQLAAEEALATVGLLYQHPLAHFCLGVAMHRLGEFARAVEALQVAVALNPNFLEAHRRLASIYERRLNDRERAAEHRRVARQIQSEERSRSAKASRPRALVVSQSVSTEARTQTDVPMPAGALTIGSSATAADSRATVLAPASRHDIITIVSGLPRSGTSMLMRMLSFGGLPVLSDGVRQADLDNPHGYFEYERATRLMRDRSWLADACGKAVKIVAPLLPFLPGDYGYNIIFIERDLREVLASQRAMLERHGRKGATLTDAQLQSAFQGQIASVKAWLRDRERTRTLFLRYHEILDDPTTGAMRIDEFLAGELDTTAMAQAVDPLLSRQRVEGAY